MKISGADLIAFLQTGWPGLENGTDDDWYWDHDVFTSPDPAATYDTDDLGPIFYQGKDPELSGRKLDLGELVTSWQKRRRSASILLSVPLDRVADLLEFAASVGAAEISIT